MLSLLEGQPHMFLNWYTTQAVDYLSIFKVVMVHCFSDMIFDGRNTGPLRFQQGTRTFFLLELQKPLSLVSSFTLKTLSVLCVIIFCAQSLSHVRLSVAAWNVVCQTPLSMVFSRQEYWSGLQFPFPCVMIGIIKTLYWSLIWIQMTLNLLLVPILSVDPHATLVCGSTARTQTLR